MKQGTLENELVLRGVGIHTGTEGRITVCPAPPNSGRVFEVNGTLIPARADFVVDTQRCTTLGNNGERVSTVEHLLSALFVCGVDNARIVVEGSEIPILDGSALPFLEAVRLAGVGEQCAEVVEFVLESELTFTDRDCVMRATPSEDYVLEVTTTFPNWEEGRAQRTFRFTDQVVDEYQAQIALARTFAFDYEVRWLLEQGLAKGGSLDNALVIAPPAQFSTPLRIEAEWCRHKILDLIGDLALLNCRPQMRVSAVCPGHRNNVSLAQRLLKQIDPDD